MALAQYTVCTKLCKLNLVIFKSLALVPISSPYLHCQIVYASVPSHLLDDPWIVRPKRHWLDHTVSEQVVLYVRHSQSSLSHPRWQLSLAPTPWPSLGDGPWDNWPPPDSFGQVAADKYWQKQEACLGMGIAISNIYPWFAADSALLPRQSWPRNWPLIWARWLHK